MLYKPFEDKNFTKYRYFGLHNQLARFFIDNCLYNYIAAFS